MSEARVIAPSTFLPQFFQLLVDFADFDREA